MVFDIKSCGKDDCKCHPMWVLVRAEVPPGLEESWDAEARRPKDFQLQEMNLSQTREEGGQVLS